MNIEQYKKLVEEEADKVLGLNDSALRCKVKDFISERISDITAKALGFSNHWGKWEVDHCNGRATFVHDRIHKYANEVAIQLVDAEIKKFKFTKQMVDACREDFRQAITQYVNEFAREYAEDAARKFVDKIANEVLKDEGYACEDRNG